MSRRDRILALLLLLLTVVAAKLGDHLYRFYRYSDERVALQQLQGSLEETALEVVRSQLAADSLQEEIQRMDRALETARQGVRAYDLRTHRGALPRHLYGEYQLEVNAYNGAVGERNERFDEWRTALERNHSSVDRFNALADSMRMVATQMGEPYFSIPTPVEVAVERGVLVLEGS